MSAVPKPEPPLDEHRLEMIRVAREVSRKAGIPEDQEGTIQELHALQRARGPRTTSVLGT